MARYLSNTDTMLIFSSFLVLTLLNDYGVSCYVPNEEELVIKQGWVDLRILKLENMMQTTVHEVAQCRDKIIDLEIENAETKNLLYWLATMTPVRDFFNAYKTGHCSNSWTSNGYSEKLNKTVHGRICQRWDQQYPHKHSYTNGTAFPDDSPSYALNFCRDPSNSGYTWCFTTDPNVRWEPCDVTRCKTEYSPNLCRHFDEDSTEYKGHLNVTFDGYSCQRWNSQYPHRHNYTSSQFPEGNIDEAGNYCRDPGHWGLPWCYTNDPNTTWKVCNIARCYESQQSKESKGPSKCYNNGKSKGYTGYVNVTATGKACQRWDRQYPQEHSYTNVTTFPDTALSDAVNYCRDPSNSGYTWCYTTDPDVRWAPCDVTRCMSEYRPNQCYRGNETSTAYRGRLDVTIDGKTCQKWRRHYPNNHDYKSDQFPEGDIWEAENYCRDPGNWGLPWCYTTVRGGGWGVCDVARCKEEKSHMYGRCFKDGYESNAYDGKLSKTANGNTCQRWDNQFPHKHSFDDFSKFPDDSLSDAGNYCRDPSDSGFTWCFTTDPNVRWEPCDVSRCLIGFDANVCYPFSKTSKDYRGHLNLTIGGQKCQKWSEQFPTEHNYQSSQFPEGDIQEAGNYCRDPAGWGLPWCYTTDLNTGWNVCDVAKCLI